MAQREMMGELNAGLHRGWSEGAPRHRRRGRLPPPLRRGVAAGVVPASRPAPVGAGCAAGVPARRLRGRRGVAGARFAVEGDQPGELVAFYGYSAFLMIPLRTGTEVVNGVIHGLVAGRRICRVLSVRPELVDVDSPKRVAAGSDLVDVRSGLRVQAGQLTAVVSEVPEVRRWRTGSGASQTAPLLGGVSLSSSSAGSFARRSSSATPTPPCSAVGSATSSTCAGTAATRTSCRGGDGFRRGLLETLDAGLDSGSRSAGVRSPVASGGLVLVRALAAIRTTVLVEPTSAVDAPPRPASPSGSPSTGRADDRRHDRQPAVAGPGRPGGADAARTGRRGREAPRPHGGRAVPEDRRARRRTDGEMLPVADARGPALRASGGSSSSACSPDRRSPLARCGGRAGCAQADRQPRGSGLRRHHGVHGRQDDPGDRGVPARADGADPVRPVCPSRSARRCWPSCARTSSNSRWRCRSVRSSRPGQATC